MVRTGPDDSAEGMEKAGPDDFVDGTGEAGPEIVSDINVTVEEKASDLEMGTFGEILEGDMNEKGNFRAEGGIHNFQPKGKFLHG